MVTGSMITFLILFWLGDTLTFDELFGPKAPRLEPWERVLIIALATLALSWLLHAKALVVSINAMSSDRIISDPVYALAFGIIAGSPET